jgi:AcrR family transcriptional regulator
MTQARRAVLRADAERNREAVVRAARIVFGEQGIDAPLDEIARRAGVGNATLYRRFPTRDDLIVAVFTERLVEHAQAAERALAEPDPWIGFRDYLMCVCRVQATDRGLADLLTMSTPEIEGLDDLRGRAYHGFVDLVHRAQTAGALRVDFVPEDLVLLLMANAGLVLRTSTGAPKAWERFVSFLLDGLRADAATPAPPPPTEQQVLTAMSARSAAVGSPPHRATRQ